MSHERTVPAGRPNVTPEAIAAMRDWIAECTWGHEPFDPDATREWVAELTDYAVLRGIERHYFGGLLAFLGTMESGAAK